MRSSKWRGSPSCADGLIVLSGAEPRRARPARCSPATTRARSRSPSGSPARSRAASTSRCSAAACPATRRTCAPRSSSPRGSRCRWSRRIRCSSSTADDHEAHEARVCVADGEMLANPRRVKRFSREQYFKTPGADGGALRRPAERARQHGRDRQALQPEPGARQAAAARLRDAARRRRARCRWPSTSASPSHEGLEARLAQLYPDAAVRERERPRYVARLDFEIETILKMGFPGYFLIVADFINWAKTQRLPGRARAAARAPARWSRTRSTSPTSIRCATSCCSSASSIPSGCRCPTSTSTSARATATASSTTSRTKYGRDAVSQIATFGTMAAQGGAARHRPRARHGLRPRRLASPS